jgi:hypothetical protein
MKRESIVILCLASIAVVAVLLATIAPALAADPAPAGSSYAQGKGMSDHWGRMGRMGHMAKDVYTTIAVDGMSGDTATFSVMDMAAKGKEGNAVLITPKAPLAGTYNTSNDMGYISTADFMPATITVDTADKTSIPVAGASAVMGIGDIKVLTREKGYHVFQYSNVSFFLPNGSTMAYKLDKPVRCTFEKDREMMVIDGYPSYTKTLSDVLGAAGTFPADTPPMPLTSLVAAKKAVTVVPVTYEKPAYVAPPT